MKLQEKTKRTINLHRRAHKDN